MKRRSLFYFIFRLRLFRTPQEYWVDAESSPISTGPVCISRAGRWCHSTVQIPNGRGRAKTAAGQAGPGGPATPPVVAWPASVGVLQHAGPYRQLHAAAACGTKSVPGDVATAPHPPSKLPQAELQAAERQPVGADRLMKQWKHVSLSVISPKLQTSKFL